MLKNNMLQWLPWKLVYVGLGWDGAEDVQSIVHLLPAGCWLPMLCIAGG